MAQDFAYWNALRAKSLAKNPLRRSPIKRKAVRIKKVSVKHAKRLREYEKEKAISRAEVEVCEFPGCNSVELTCHHSAGRIGANLTDRKKFKWLCWPHHLWAEENPGAAKELGLSVSRLDKAS